jgi:acyl-CoA synthetase (NDP forming)
MGILDVGGVIIAIIAALGAWAAQRAAAKAVRPIRLSRDAWMRNVVPMSELEHLMWLPSNDKTTSLRSSGKRTRL